jgi:lysozyme
MPRWVPTRLLIGCLALLAAAPALLAQMVAAAPRASAQEPALWARGIDVSNYQHQDDKPIDWPAVRASGVEFAFIKATEGRVGCRGESYTNGWLKRDWDEAGAAGIYRGAYHFARPGGPEVAIAEAQHFAAAVGPMNGPLDLPPVLDLETSCGLPPAQLSVYVRTWVDEVTKLTGRSPIIYTGYYNWKDRMADDASFGHLPLWVATYGPRPLVPPAWYGWMFWQHTDKATVPGIEGNVDMNWFAGGGAALTHLTPAGMRSRT